MPAPIRILLSAFVLVAPLHAEQVAAPAPPAVATQIAVPADQAAPAAAAGAAQNPTPRTQPAPVPDPSTNAPGGAAGEVAASSSRVVTSVRDGYRKKSKNVIKGQSDDEEAEDDSENED